MSNTEEHESRPFTSAPEPSGPAQRGGQELWIHDEGHPYGHFHTYDALALAGHPARKVHVFLPRQGTAAPPGGYPVVYMNDGQSVFWPGGLGNKSWQVAETLSHLAAAQAIAPLMVVAIHPLDREREYTHRPFSPGHTCCGLPEYTDYVAHHLKPFIDAHYPTAPAPRDTAIVGSSYGGLASFYMATRAPHVFGKAGVVSPAFWVDMGWHYELRRGWRIDQGELIPAVAELLADPQRRPILWLDWGLIHTGGFHNEVIESLSTVLGRAMVELLQQRFAYRLGVDLQVCEDPQGEHDEVSWSRRLPDLLRFLYPPSSPQRAAPSTADA